MQMGVGGSCSDDFAVAVVSIKVDDVRFLVIDPDYGVI